MSRQDSKKHGHFDHLIDTVYPGKENLSKELKKRKLRVYLGVDVTAPIIHLGHAIPLRLLSHFQEMGHYVIVLIGDFTTLIGDPSGRSKARPTLTEKEITQNLATYKQQVFKILDSTKTEIVFNSQWYTNPAKMGSLRKFLDLGKEFTAQQLWERDMFQERQAKGHPVTLTEFIYPILQAYDSVELNVDVEVGATDQTFNMLRGRDLVKRYLNKEKFVITTPLLLGSDGRKMSKSYDNYIALTDSAQDMYVKLMQINDDLIEQYFLLAADIDPRESELSDLIRIDPRAAKAKMALEVVALYHGFDQAEVAQMLFDRRAKTGIPEDITTKTPSLKGQQLLMLYLVDLDLVSSKSEARRVIEQGGVRVDNMVIIDANAIITPHDGMVINVGKRKFLKIKF